MCVGGNTCLRVFFACVRMPMSVYARVRVWVHACMHACVCVSE